MAKKKSTAIVPYDAEMAKYAEETSATEKGVGGAFINFKSGQISIDGTPAQDNELTLIVLGAIHENAYFPLPYDENNPGQAPSCYAFSVDGGDEMAPAENGLGYWNSETEEFEKPELCKGCPMNEFGSGRGRAKACQNRRRLAVISASDLDPDTLRTTDVRYIKLSPLNAKRWAGYVKFCAESKIPYFGMVTRLYCESDEQSQFAVKYEPKGRVPADVWGVVRDRHLGIMGEIEFPYGDVDGEAVKEQLLNPPKKRMPPARKAVGKRTGKVPARKF